MYTKHNTFGSKKNIQAKLTETRMILMYIIIAFCLAVGIRQPAFFSPATVITIMRAGIFTMCFALCEMVVIISGGIDVSFPAVACVAMYVPMYIINRVYNIDSALFAFGLAIFIGLAFGLLNGFLVSILKLPALIATLAISSIAYGGLITLLGTREFTVLPKSLKLIYDTNLFTYTAAGTGFKYPLNILVLLPIVVSILVAWMLQKTMMGRGLYAIGGDKSSAMMAGFFFISSPKYKSCCRR